MTNAITREQLQLLRRALVEVSKICEAMEVCFGRMFIVTARRGYLSDAELRTIAEAEDPSWPRRWPNNDRELAAWFQATSINLRSGRHVAPPPKCGRSEARTHKILFRMCHLFPVLEGLVCPCVSIICDLWLKPLT